MPEPSLKLPTDGQHEKVADGASIAAPEKWASDGRCKNQPIQPKKADIWSLGCVLFALAYLHSPFETTQTTEQGGSIAMAVMSARYKHPASYQYSDGFKKLIDSMLKVDPAERPDIHQVRTVDTHE